MSDAPQTGTPRPDDTLIQIDGLTKRFGTRTILCDITLHVRAGETVCLIGPSGGGKSTLLRCINGLNTFDEGALRVDRHVLLPGAARGNANELRQVRQLLGMVFQDFQLFPHFTALQNVVEAPQRVAGMSREAARKLGEQLLARVGLADRADFFPAQLSGGQKQRVAIARALAMSPRGLLCDEITSALDPELKNDVLTVLEDLKREGLTLLMVTHEIGFARRAADRVVVLADGGIVEAGPPATVLDNPQTAHTQRFLQCVLG